MGIAIPQVITPSKASSAQVIDGTVGFTSEAQTHLKRTPSSEGNRKTFTYSCWVKRDSLGDNPVNNKRLFSAQDTDAGSSSYSSIYFRGTGLTGQLEFLDYLSGTREGRMRTEGRPCRDTSGWYHICVAVDYTDSTAKDRIKIYINGVRQGRDSTNDIDPDTTDQTFINSTEEHNIGKQPTDTDKTQSGRLSQVYLIDGQALGPEYFGFTDPLTNTWKPKKYNVPKADTVLVGTPTYASSDFKTTGDKTSDQTALSFGSWTNYTGAETKIFKNSTDSAFTLNIHLIGGTTDRYLWGSNNLTNWTYIANAGARHYQLSGYKYYATSEGSSSTTLKAIAENGPNSFYLPLDGNSPIGQDQSGNGNDWTPVNFGGSVALDNPQVSGARPILNTTQGGAQAGVGVFGSKENVGYAVTVYNDGGGNKYYIDGVKQDTVTGLIRGATYTFDTSDSTVSSHPFRFSATSNGSHGGGSEYTNGVAAITGAATTITVPHDAPNTLYYYCTSHSGMGADITGITTNEKLADQYASNIVFASPLVGANSDVSASIACTMTNKAITSNGNAAAAYEASNFYTGSFEFDGTGDTLTSAQSSDLTMGTADFTVECWARQSDTSHRGIWQISNTSGGLEQSSYGTTIAVGARGTDWQIYGAGSSTESSTYPIRSGIWYHLAYVRSSGTSKLYVNGIEVISKSNDTTNYNGTYLVIGGYYNSSYLYNGYIQDFRVYKGVAKYTSDFVVPSRSPDILPDTPSGVSGGSKLAKITDGAVSFDGTGDYLSLADNDDFDLGTGDFTFEAFFNQTLSHTNYRYIFSHYDGSNGHWLRTDGDGPGRVQFGSGGTVYITSTTKVALNKWYHVAVVRVGTTVTLYLDGIREGTYTLSGDITSTGDFRIGRQGSSTTHYFGGFISNVRINKGSAIYTGPRITPPTEPLTNVTNTKLLCCQSPTNVRLSPVGPNVGITTTTRFNSNFESIPTTVNGLTVTNNGSVTTTSAGTNSYGFTNCADLTGSNSLSVDLGTIPALSTIDIIFKATGATDNKYLFGIGGNGLVRRSSSSFDWYNGSDTTISTSEIVDGNWHHLRVTPRRLFFDNTLITNSTSLQFINNNTTADGDNSGHMALGAFRNGSGTIQYNASVDYGLVRVMPGVDLGAPLSYPITTNGTLSDTETIPNDGIIVARGNSAATTLSPFNTDINTVRGQETGYATLNPLIIGAATLTDGNLTATKSSSGHGAGRSTLTMDTSGTGKFYFEATLALIGGTYAHIGVLSTTKTSDANYVGNTANCFSYRHDGKKQLEGTTASTYGDSFTTGDTLGCSLDCGSGELRFYKNGVDQGVATTITTDFHACFAVSNNGSNGQWVVNFGQKPFKFPPPDGFQPLNAANVRPETVISRPDQYVGVTTYTGNGDAVSPRTVELPFAADLVWAKSKDRSSSHQLADTVRGNNKVLISNSVDYERDPTSYFGGGGVASIDGKIISIESGTGNNRNLNTDGEDAVVWSWKAGGSKGTFNVDGRAYANAAAAGLPTQSGSGGGIDVAACSVGTKQGFSIIKYGAGGNGENGIPHGLGRVPKFYIVKNITSGSSYWTMYHVGMGNTKGIYFDDAAANTNDWWDDKTPTEDLFYVKQGSLYVHNGSDTYISYLWCDVPGLQKFGTYEGNNNSDGPFVELGFNPAIIWTKGVDSSSHGWEVHYNRGPKLRENPQSERLMLNENATIASSNHVDFLSNGFKIRNTFSGMNSTTDTYIYCAWADVPTVDLYGGGANAR